MCVCAYMRVWQKESTRDSSQKLCVSYRSKAAWELEEVQEAQDESIDKIGKCIEYICSCLCIIIKGT